MSHSLVEPHHVSDACFPWVLAILAVFSTALPGADGIDVRSSSFSAGIRRGSVVDLTAADGTQYVRMPAEPRGATIHRAEASHGATADEPAGTLAVGESLTAKCEDFSGLERAVHRDGL